jgi:hypothetical protein
MKLYIDTANISEIRELAWLIDGVTTNPSLVAKEKRPFKEVVREICEIVNGPVSAEATALDAGGMIEQGRNLAKIHENVVIKIPMTEEGMKAVKALTQDGIRTNVTLVFSANQALLADRSNRSERATSAACARRRPPRRRDRYRPLRDLEETLQPPAHRRGNRALPQGLGRSAKVIPREDCEVSQRLCHQRIPHPRDYIDYFFYLVK